MSSAPIKKPLRMPAWIQVRPRRVAVARTRRPRKLLKMKVIRVRRARVIRETFV